MCDFRLCTEVLLRLILSVQDLRQNQSPDTVPAYIVVSCIPHDNIFQIHLCDEKQKSHEPSVCHKLWSTWWQHVQLCWRTIKCLVYQCALNTSIKEQCVSNFLTILQQIPFLPPWTDGRQCMELRLCVNVELFCSPFRKIVPHISLHDIPYHGTMTRCSRRVSRNRVPIELSRDDQTDFAQEERLGPCWTMVWAICVSVDVSKYLDILTLELSIAMVHLPFWPACKLILRLLLVLRILVILLWHPLLSPPSCVTLMILAL